jgi:hypothetical protein
LLRDAATEQLPDGTHRCTVRAQMVKTEFRLRENTLQIKVSQSGIG